MLNEIIEAKNLIKIIKTNDEDYCKFVIETFDSEKLKKELMERDEKGYTAFHHAAERGFINVLQMFLDAGYDINDRVKDEYSDSAISIAYDNKHYECFKFLANKRANLNFEYENYGGTLLHFIQDENIDIVELLIEKGADINSICLSNFNSNTPLLSCVTPYMDGWFDKEKAVLLIKAGAEVYNAKDGDDEDTGYYFVERLFHESNEGIYDIAKALIERGDDLNRLNDKGKAPIYHIGRSYDWDGNENEFLENPDEYELQYHGWQNKDLFKLLISNGIKFYGPNALSDEELQILFHKSAFNEGKVYSDKKELYEEKIIEKLKNLQTSYQRLETIYNAYNNQDLHNVYMISKENYLKDFISTAPSSISQYIIGNSEIKASYWNRINKLKENHINTEKLELDDLIIQEFILDIVAKLRLEKELGEYVILNDKHRSMFKLFYLLTCEEKTFNDFVEKNNPIAVENNSVLEESHTSRVLKRKAESEVASQDSERRTRY